MPPETEHVRDPLEAQALLDEETRKVQAMSFAEARDLIPPLPKRLLYHRLLAMLTRKERMVIVSDDREPDQIVGASGTKYWVATSGHWQDRKGGPIAVIVAVTEAWGDGVLTREVVVEPDHIPSA